MNTLRLAESGRENRCKMIARSRRCEAALVARVRRHVYPSGKERLHVCVAAVCRQDGQQGQGLQDMERKQSQNASSGSVVTGKRN